MTEQPKPRPKFTSFAEHDSASLLNEARRYGSYYIESQTVMADCQARIDAAEKEYLVAYRDIPTPLSDLRRDLAALEETKKKLVEAIKEGEKGLRTVIPATLDEFDFAEKHAKAWLESLGRVLAEMHYRNIIGEKYEDVVLGEWEQDGQTFRIVAAQIRQSQSWDFVDPHAFLADLSPERKGFFTIEIKSGNGDVSKKMANEWLRRVIAEGTAPAGVQFAPMVLAKANDHEAIYLVPIESTSTTEVSDDNQ